MKFEVFGLKPEEIKKEITENWVAAIFIVLALLFLYGKHFVVTTEIDKLTATIYMFFSLVLAFLTVISNKISKVSENDR